jgi:lipopolysaccharide heptosyltransferase I
VSSESGERILIVRLTAMGDILHTLPAVEAVRESFPEARLDWVVDRRWAAILQGSPALNHVISVDRRSWDSIWACVRELRAASYTCSLDMQGLYKSAVLGWFSGAPRRVGFESRVARESGAALFYTEHVSPTGSHVAEHNLSIAEHIGARKPAGSFPLPACTEVEAEIRTALDQHGLRDFYAFSPGGSWRAKCWPPERFGALCRELEKAHGWRGVMILGPEERALGEEVVRAAAPTIPVWIPTDLPELAALIRKARFLVGVDSGPLHLGVAVGTPVVGIYGPTDPDRNGPFCLEDVVVRNAKPEETSYKRRDEYSPTMLSVSVEQVVAAIKERLARRRQAQPVRAQEGD